MSLSIVDTRVAFPPQDGQLRPISVEQARRNPVMLLNTKMVEEAKICECAQRVQVAMERHAEGKRVKIRVENYDSGLGWYSSGSLTVPLHQLPLLEQAVADMRSVQRDDESDYGNIIPFPGPAELA